MMDAMSLELIPAPSLYRSEAHRACTMIGKERIRPLMMVRSARSPLNSPVRVYVRVRVCA